MKALIKPAIVLTMLVTALNLSAQPPQGRGERQRMTSEERAKQRVEQLKKDLGLDEAQEKSVYDLQIKMNAEMEPMRQSGQQDREKMMAEMQKIRKMESDEMEKILTAEQFEKWRKLESERQNNRRQGQQDRNRQDRQGGQGRP